MKVSVQWLKDYIDYGISDDELFDRLTMAGLEVEDVQIKGCSKVFEMEITPNRPDCLNVLGIAQEVSAIINQKLTRPKIKDHVTTKNKVDIRVDDANDCQRYIGTLIEGVSVSKVNEHIRVRLDALGSSGVNNIVDITNFCLFELGQPMHAFDYDKLEGGYIQVRRAKKGESLVALDGEEYKLDPSILIIADAKKPVAIAGVMGGMDTGVTESTKNILLESAHFDMGLVRRASRKLSLYSDSSYRFERGIDIDTIALASNRATDLILDLAGGKVTAKTDVKSFKKAKPKSITLTSQAIVDRLGTNIALSKAKTILTKLDCEVDAGKEALKVTPPVKRKDLVASEDLIEEVARVIGYDNLPMSMPNIPADNIVTPKAPWVLKQNVSDVLRAQSCDEIVTFSLVSEQDLQPVEAYAHAGLCLQNSLSKDHDRLRPSMLPSFLHVYKNNQHRGQSDVRLFEIGKNYFPKGERDFVGVLISGVNRHDWREGKLKDVDFYDVKGIVEELCAQLKVDITFQAIDTPLLEAGQAAGIFLGKKQIGMLGKISQTLIDQWRIKKGKAYFAEMDLEEVKQSFTLERKFVEISDYPSVGRDVSLAVPLDVPFSHIEEICWKTAGKLLKDVKFLDLYTGDKIEANHRGVVFSLTYQDTKRTLTEDEVNHVHEALCQKLMQDLSVKIR